MHIDSFNFLVYTDLQDIYIFKCVTFDLIQYRVVLINALIFLLCFQLNLLGWDALSTRILDREMHKAETHEGFPKILHTK